MKNSLHIPYLLFFILITNTNANCQPSDMWDWLEQKNDPFIQERSYTLIELNNGKMILTGFKSDLAKTENRQHQFIWMLGHDGQLTKELYIPSDTFGLQSQYEIMDIFETKDSLLFIGSSQTHNNLPALLYMYTDKQLNIGRYGYHEVQLPPPDPEHHWECYNTDFVKMLPHPDGGYYAACAVNEMLEYEPDSPGYRIFYRFNEQMEIIHKAYFSTIYESERPNIIYNPQTFRYFSCNMSGESFLLDSTFQLIKQTPDLFRKPQPYQYRTWNSHAVLRPFKGNYLMANTCQTMVKINNDPDPGIAYFEYSHIITKIFDGDFRMIDSIALRPINADSGSSTTSINDKAFTHLNGLDFINEDSIYFLYYDKKTTDGLDYGTYTLFMTDSTFATRWAKKIEVDRPIEVYSIKAVKDGGCLVIGLVWNVYDFDKINVDVYVAKHTATGERTSVYTIPFKQTEMELYPNPASRYLKLSTSLQNLNIAFFTIDGKKALDTNMSSSKEIDISTLDNGLYFYRITTEKNQLQKTGKVLVEH